MRLSGIRWPEVAVSAGVIIAACTGACGPADDHSSASLSNGHMIHIEAAYVVGVSGIDVNGYGDVADGTAGTLVVGGVGNWRCPGVFRKHDPVGDAPRPWKDLPWFTVAGAQTLQFYGPPGRYVFTLSAASPSGSVSRSVMAGHMSKDPSGSHWGKPPTGCTPPDGLPDPGT